MKNKDKPWAERWPEPEFDQQGWKEVMTELSNMAGKIADDAIKIVDEGLIGYGFKD